MVEGEESEERRADVLTEIGRVIIAMQVSKEMHGQPLFSLPQTSNFIGRL